MVQCVAPKQSRLQHRLMSALLLQATRNFVQLCAEGFYDGTPFFRMVKGAYVQAS